jgi:hypothetical protein
VDASEFLRSLVGRDLRTPSGRPNRILSVGDVDVTVATERSPAGQPVLLALITDAIDRLQRDGELEISVQSVGHRSAFVGAVLREIPGAAVLPTSPPRIRLGR